MNLAIIILFVVLAILFCLIILPMGVGLKYENGIFFIFKVSFISFDIPFNKKLKKPSRPNKKKPAEQNNDKPEESLNRSIIGLDFLLDVFGKSANYVHRHLSLEKFQLKIEFGTSDAAVTAISVGSMWALSYNLLALIDKLIWVKDPYIDIKPSYNNPTFKASVQGIIVTRAVHIIAVAIIFAYKYLKYKKLKKEDK